MNRKITNLCEHVQNANRLAGVEYTLIASVITCLIVAVFMFLGNRVFDTVNYIAGKF
jgi:Flp pilus assembly pilin Flp